MCQYSAKPLQAHKLMPYSMEESAELTVNGSALKSRPLIQHEFFPGHSSNSLLQGAGQTHSVMPNLSLEEPAITQSPQIWEGFTKPKPNVENMYDPGSRHHKDSWEWDIFSSAAQPVSTALSFDGAQRALRSCVDKSSFATPSCHTSMPLELELKSSSDEDGLLTLKLGGNGYSWRGDDHLPSVKRCRHSPPETQEPRCQVDNCSADLGNAKDYHRHHKVCEVHSKAPKVPVSRIMQRFCQQCSRFHFLQEFDANRRSCRRRLAGHNSRRRKTRPDTLACLLEDQNFLSGIINSCGQVEGKDGFERMLKVLTGGDLLLQTLLRAKATVENVENRSAETSCKSNNLVDAVQTNMLNNLLLSNPALPVTPISSLMSALLMYLPHMMQQNKEQVAGMPDSKQQATVSIKEREKPSWFPVETTVANNINTALLSDQQDGCFRHCNSEHPIYLSLSSSAEPILAKESTVPFQSFGNADDLNMYLMEDRIPAFNAQRKSLNSLLQPDKQGFREDSDAQKSKEISVGMVLDQGATWVSASENFQRVKAIWGEAPEYEPPESQSTCSKEPLNTPALEPDQSSDSGCDIQIRTDRIVFKLFDRSPKELPSTLREQILDWLNYLPTNMESYIRPGCVILTLFLCMPICAWERLCTNIEGSLFKLVQSRTGEIWSKGRVLVQSGKASAFINEGNISSSMSLESIWTPHLRLVWPFAITIGETVELTVRGYDLKVPGTRLICSHGGKSLDKETTMLSSQQRNKERDGDAQNQGRAFAHRPNCEHEILNFCVGSFNTVGLGFIEVEGQMLKGNAFPILVVEKAICEEICSLEEELESSLENESVLDKLRQSKLEVEITHFLYELGWLFQRTRWQMSDINAGNQEFSSTRLRWLLLFAVKHRWCAVVKKVLDLLFSTGDESVEIVQSRALETLSEVNLLHIAVRTNSMPMVQFLLAYSPPSAVHEVKKSYLFRPDMLDLDGLTPLHIAASMHAADGIVDALTNAPEQFWVPTWISAKDSVGRTPMMHAVAAGNDVFVRMVQKKLHKLGKLFPLTERTGYAAKFIDRHPSSHVALNILIARDEKNSKLQVSSSPGMPSLKKPIQHCTCNNRNLIPSQNRFVRSCGIRGSMYRPFMLSILVIAAVCVCVGVLMKCPPNVEFGQPPFVWESIEYGFI